MKDYLEDCQQEWITEHFEQEMNNILTKQA